MTRRKKTRAARDDDAYFAEDDGPTTTPVDRPRVGYRYWPVAVPTLTAADVVYDGTTPDGRRDMCFWVTDTFDFAPAVNNMYVADEARAVLCEVITERYGRTVTDLGGFMMFAHKARRPSKAFLAAAWNEMLRRLGYEVSAAACKEDKV